jgi:hypothetical protein
MKRPTKTATETHPWVALTRACFDKAAPDSNGLIWPLTTERLNVCVSRAAIPRAMEIMDRLLKALEEKGFALRMADGPPCRTVVTVDDQALSISLKEKTTRREHVPTPPERAKMEKYKYGHGVPTWDYHPSGTLVLSIDVINSRQELVNEVKWADGKRKRIDDRVAGIGDELPRMVREMKARWARAKAAHQAWEEELRRREEAARMQAKEAKRAKALKAQAAAWRQARSVRKLAQATREEAVRRHGEIEPDSPLDRWLRWVEGQADAIDPIPTILAGTSPRKESRPAAPAEAAAQSNGRRRGPRPLQPAPGVPASVLPVTFSRQAAPWTSQASISVKGTRAPSWRRRGATSRTTRSPGAW